MNAGATERSFVSKSRFLASDAFDQIFDDSRLEISLTLDPLPRGEGSRLSHYSVAAAELITVPRPVLA